LGIEWYRDLIICISGVVTAAALIFITILAYRTYRRLYNVIESTQDIAKIIQDITSFAGDNVIKPLIEIAAIIRGVRQGIEMISKKFGKGEEGKNE
jgi:hypothetical protein